MRIYREEMEGKLRAKEEEILELECRLRECQENENAMLTDYNREIEDLNLQLEQERKSAKEGLLALAEFGKSQEEMFTSSIYEVEKLMKGMILGNNSKEENLELLELKPAEVKKTLPQTKRLTRNITSLTKESEQLPSAAQASRKKMPLARTAQPRIGKR